MSIDVAGNIDCDAPLNEDGTVDIERGVRGDQALKYSCDSCL